jgi:hypothetical protein
MAIFIFIYFLRREKSRWTLLGLQWENLQPLLECAQVMFVNKNHAGQQVAAKLRFAHEIRWLQNPLPN